MKNIIDVLKNIPHKRGAEIGISEGVNAYNLLNGLPDLKTFYLVDRWLFYNECPRTKAKNLSYDEIRKRFFNRLDLFQDRIILLWMDSLKAAQQVKDNSLDFIYIDANHYYQFVLANIVAWTPKVKDGGIISGHDYGYGEKERGFGVKKAVNDCFGVKNVNVDNNTTTWWLVKGEYKNDSGIITGKILK